MISLSQVSNMSQIVNVALDKVVELQDRGTPRIEALDKVIRDSYLDHEEASQLVRDVNTFNEETPNLHTVHPTTSGK